MRSASLIAVLSVVLVPACGDPTVAAPADRDILPITCSTHYRAAVTESLEDGPVLVFDGTGQEEKEAPFEELTLRAQHFNDEFDARSLNLSVSEPGRKHPLFNQLFQMDQNQAPDNIFGGTGQGFTGLLYAYSSNGAELQFICESG